MDILKELDNVKQIFENTQQNAISTEKTLNSLLDELKTLQGEYRALVRIAQKEGLLDSEGKVIEKNDENLKEIEAEKY
jgi:tRNA U55 pseudouridine synthase TruB